MKSRVFDVVVYDTSLSAIRTIQVNAECLRDAIRFARAQLNSNEFIL